MAIAFTVSCSSISVPVVKETQTTNNIENSNNIVIDFWSYSKNNLVSRYSVFTYSNFDYFQVLDGYDWESKHEKI
ncbi:hypothetical protein EI74_0637 [Mycoplasma testudineum]|uniref:Uncharacterized protein n=2 Tax=Mycoplasma testudineum TaxID=244584 RepID=A0A4R6ICW9_9MOLU|nr:hypothetical protein CG473_02785 [Mycoplasma testudineum]TDO19832.1 hypothetical protein EI74_0637 [Mycoplasma testudineum]